MYQITIQGYNSDGLFEKAVHEQSELDGVKKAKDQARACWVKFKEETALPFIQAFIIDMAQKQKRVLQCKL